VLAIGRKEQWSLSETSRVTLIAGLAHATSTVLIGAVLAFIGASLSVVVENFTAYIAPGLLVVLGGFYIYQHSRHHHFHMHGHPERVSKNKLIVSLASAMFFSPCFEIEAYFLVAGTMSWWTVILLAVLYTVVTVGGMVIWVRFAYRGLHHMNWHSLEHNAGIITGAILMVTGVITFFVR